MNKYKKGDIVIWDNQEAIIYSKTSCQLAYNNGIGYGIKLLTGQNIGKKLYISETQITLKSEVKSV